MSKVFEEIKRGLEQALAYEKGEWILEEHEGYTIALCPACGKEAVTDEYTGKPILSNYCPECGKLLKPQSDQEYIESVPGLKEKILEAGKTPVEECIPDSEAIWTVERDPDTGQLITSRPAQDLFE